MKFSAMLFGLMAWVALVDAQPPSLLWEKSYGGTRGDLIYDMVLTRDGGAAFCGESNSVNYDLVCNTDSTNADYWVGRLNANGQLLWSKCFGGSSVDIAYGIAAASDGGFVVVGASSSSNGDVTCSSAGSSSNYWVLKLDSMGNLQWQKCYGGTAADVAQYVVSTADGGYLVSGYSHSANGDVSNHHGPNGGTYDYWIVKIDSAGTLQWEKSLGGNDEEYALAGIEFSKGKYAVCGFSHSYDGDVTSWYPLAYNADMCWIVMLDSSGNIIWNKAYGGTCSQQGQRLARTPDGNLRCLVMGCSHDGIVSDDHGGGDYNVIEVDSNGAFLWGHAYGGAGEELPRDMASTPDSGFVVIGLSQNSGGTGQVSGNYGNNDYWLIKADKTGNLQWEKNFGGAREDVGYAAVYNNGALYCAGYTASFNEDVSYNHDTSGFSADGWILKLDYNAFSNTEHANDVRIDAFPNPVSGILQLTLTGATTNALVEILNVMGRRVYVRKLSPVNGTIHQAVDMSDFPSGVYAVVLRANGNVYTRKIIRQ